MSASVATAAPATAPEDSAGGGVQTPDVAPAPGVAPAPAAGSIPVASVAKQVGRQTLRTGSTGARVTALHKLLSANGFTVPEGGEYIEGTATIVRSFQIAARLPVNGVANKVTIRRIVTAASGTEAAAYSAGGFSANGGTAPPRSLGDRIPLQAGMSGRDVKILQDYLTRAGVSAKIDGEYGKGTIRAVRTFESSKGIEADGVADAFMLATLRETVEGGGNSAATSDPGVLQTAPGSQATVGPDGLAIAPEDAPDAVKQIIAAGNKIARSPYVYGGGHAADWSAARGYDCSGSVSYALNGVAGLLDAPRPSYDFYNWGEQGVGQWVTIYTKKSHMYMIVAGLRFDTSGRTKAGTRWQAAERSSNGFVARHPSGL